MATPSFLASFRALGTTAARVEALAALLGELSSHEWRQLHRLASARSFQFDIVAALPTELVLHVFSYLDTSTPFRLQRVSRRWCALLRSTDILKPALRAWYDDAVDLEAVAYDDCLREAQGIHRFRTGHHVDVVVTPPTSDGLFAASRTALVEDVLVEIPLPSRQLSVTNLRTGASWKAHGEAREKISHLAASKDLVAFCTTTNLCYVYTISGEQQAKFRLPPNWFSVFTCRNRTVVCGGFLEHFAEFYIWDLDSQTGKSLRLDYDQPLFFPGIDHSHCIQMNAIPNPRLQNLTLFTTRTCETRWCGHDIAKAAIRYAQVAFDGRVIQHREFTIPVAEEASNFAGTSITSIRPVDRRGSFCIKVFARYNSNGYNSCFQFDEESQIFTNPDCPNSRGDALWSEHVSTQWFKDSYYQLCTDYDVHQNVARLTFVHLGTSGEAHLDAQPFIDEADCDVLFGGTSTHMLLNDKFAVVLGLGRKYVVSFAKK